MTGTFTLDLAPGQPIRLTLKPDPQPADFAAFVERAHAASPTAAPLRELGIDADGLFAVLHVPVAGDVKVTLAPVTEHG